MNLFRLLKAGLLRAMLRSHRFMRLSRRLPFHLGFGGRMWITRNDEATEVLTRRREFGMPYEARMEQLGTTFILGLNPSKEYDVRRKTLVRALETIEPDVLAGSTRDHARKALEGCGGRIDLIGTLTDGVLAETMGPVLWSDGPLTGAEVAQARAVARDIFINPLGDREVRRRAEAEAPRLRERAEGLVAARRNPTRRMAGGGEGDVLGALLGSGSAAGRRRVDDDEQAVNDLLGLMVAWVTSVSRTMGFAFDELLSPQRANQLEMAQMAARNDDPGKVGEILLEALRFKPSMPALDRVCTRDTRVRGTTIPRGRNLWVVLTSVMMDGHGYPCPEVFREGGPEREYLHFGHPGRRCLGEAVARRQMEAISVELLRCPNLRRTSKLKLDGPYPKSLPVAFDTASS